MSRFNLRQQPRVSYYEPDAPNLDEYVFCTECADFVFEYCSIHGPLLVIPDDKVPAKPNVPATVPRAALTIPHVFLHLARSVIPGAGIGVFTTLTLPRDVRFGPYRGLRKTEVNSTYCWQIYDNDSKASHAIDANDPNRSNWMRYVNCSRHWCEQNLTAYQYRGQIYYRTTRIIPRFTELMVFYGSEFANQLGVNLKRYNSPLSFAEKLGTKICIKSTSDQKGFISNSQEEKQENLGELSEKNSKDSTIYEDGGSLQNTKNLDEIKIPVHTRTPEKNIIHKNIRDFEDATDLRKHKHIGKYSTVLNKHEYKTIRKHVIIDENIPLKINNTTNRIAKENIRHIDLHDTAVVTSMRIQSADDVKLDNNNIYVHETECAGSDVDNILITLKILSCEFCPFKSPSEKRLNSHLKAHTANKSFNCVLCHFKTVSSSYLIKHNRIHSGVKPYTCDICKKAFNERNSLQTHLRIHSGVKPYTCDICKKAFNVRNNLQTHLRIHSGVKPYTCDICKKAFNQRNNLQRHLRIHSRVKSYTCM